MADCICQPGDLWCRGVPGETEDCEACLELDPEAPCVIEFEEEPECTCAMTEASQVHCARHGYDAPEQ